MASSLSLAGHRGAQSSWPSGGGGSSKTTCRRLHRRSRNCAKNASRPRRDAKCVIRPEARCSTRPASRRSRPSRRVEVHDERPFGRKRRAGGGGGALASHVRREVSQQAARVLGKLRSFSGEAQGSEIERHATDPTRRPSRGSPRARQRVGLVRHSGAWSCPRRRSPSCGTWSSTRSAWSRRTSCFAAVWGDTVVSEAALTSCIRDLRKALADSSRTPRYIETVHRRGFRFIGPVGAAERARRGAPAAPADVPPSARRSSAATPSSRGCTRSSRRRAAAERQARLRHRRGRDREDDAGRGVPRAARRRRRAPHRPRAVRRAVRRGRGVPARARGARANGARASGRDALVRILQPVRARPGSRSCRPCSPTRSSRRCSGGRTGRRASACCAS